MGVSINIHLHLLYFVGYCTGILAGDMEFEDFLDTDFNVKAECREALLADKSLLEEYIADGSEISEEQLAIVKRFRKNIKSQFVLLKCLSKHAILKDIENDKFYAVKALSNTFDELLPFYPIIITLNILPFKNQIIYDGFFVYDKIHIGPNIKKSLHEEYAKAKKNKEIIMTLD